MKTDADLIDIARAAVPDHLKPLGRIVRRGLGERAVTASGPHAGFDDSLIQSIAEEVGAELGDATADSADVEFVEHTQLGAKSTIVQIRDGKVAQVLKRA